MLKLFQGFRGMCLKACAEVSVWTDFSENKLSQLMDHQTELNLIIENLESVERFLARPPKVPNINKRKTRSQEHVAAKSMKIESKSVCEEIYSEVNSCVEFDSSTSRIDHNFLEGPDITVTDLIFFPCLTLIWVRKSILLNGIRGKY